MLRNKSATLISIGGLALGMCCALLIFLYIQFELSHDSFHKKQNLIYQVVVKGEKQNRETEYRSSIVHELAERIKNSSFRKNSDLNSRVNDKDNFVNRMQQGSRFKSYFLSINYSELPGSHYITDIARMAPQTGYVRYKDRLFEENFFYFTESSIFRMFDFPLQKGDPNTALSRPGSIVLTPEMVEKYFANEDPLGKVIRFKLPSEPAFFFKVTGILQPIPDNSSMQIHFLAALSFGDLKSNLPQWQPIYTYTYIEFGGVKRKRRSIFQTILRDLIIFYRPIPVTSVVNDFNKELAKIRIADFYADHLYTHWYFTTTAFRDAYFAKDQIFTSFAGQYVETLKKGNLLSVLLLFVLALLILAISCINVINLSTARSAGRAREIAVRKVMGADRGQLICQFLTESTLLSFISLLLSLSLAELLLPGFNHMLHRKLATDYAHNWRYLAAMASIVLMAGLFSGIYPAFFLSSFPAVETMKGENIPASTKLRKWLMIFQITASVSILIFSFLLSRESSFLRNKYPGFQAEQIIFFKIDHAGLRHVYPEFKKDLLNIAGVSHVTASSLAAWEYGISGLSSFSVPNTGLEADKKVQARLLLVDSDFLRLYKIPMTDGVNFPERFNNREHPCILNQAARKFFDLEDIVGKKLLHGGKNVRQILGVSEDFHYHYPWHKIEPLVMIQADEYYGMQRPYISVRLLPGDPDPVIQIIEKTVRRFFPESIFNYRYLDREMEKILKEKNSHWERILKFAGAVSIFLAALGLAGFAEYEAGRKSKEIGIRKALGATRMQICIAFVQQFVPMVLIANVIAWSFSFLLIPMLLDIIDYPYPFRMGLPVFMFSSILTLLITLLTVSFRIFRAASVNSSDALRDE